MAFYPLGDFWQVFAGILLEVRGVAVSFERSVIFILLVDEKAAGLGLVAMHLILRATRLLARLLGELCKYRSDFGFTSSFCHPGNRQNYHRATLLAEGSK